MINLAEWTLLSGIEKYGIKCIKSFVNLISDHFSCDVNFTTWFLNGSLFGTYICSFCYCKPHFRSFQCNERKLKDLLVLRVIYLDYYVKSIVRIFNFLSVIRTDKATNVKKGRGSFAKK